MNSRRPCVRRLALALVLAGAAGACAQTGGRVRAILADPPAAARPMVRWWWFGPAVNKPELLRELKQMQADGIGGAELAFVYAMQLDGNLPFLSAPMLDMVHFAESEGRKLGLRIDVTLCSGWPYGGPHIPLQLAAGRLRTYEVAVPPHAASAAFPQRRMPGETLVSVSLVSGAPGHRNAASEQMLPVPPAGEQAISLTPADGDRVALFFYAGHTRQQVKRAAVGAEGYVLDPFSHAAVATHLKAVGEPLLSAFGSTPPYAIFSDSLEAYGADWTPDFPAEFARRRGYDLLPHLAEFVAGGTPEAEKVRHDYGVTLTELINENYLVQINDWAKAHGTRFRSQTYGEPAVSFSSQRLAALPEGEGPQWRAFSTLRWASSANHVFGNNVTSGESFTWLHSPVFRATPLDMKAEADIDFLSGENQLIFHGWPYSPPASELPPGDPGWSLYAAAVFNDHNPWHPVMPAVTRYITRVSAVLREGKPANQVALLLPTDDAWAGFSPGKVSVTEAMKKLVPRELMDAILAAGYNVDFIDADAIDRVGLGEHELLVLPPSDRIPVKTLQAIYQWRMQHPDNAARPSARDYNVLCYQRCPSIDPDGKPLPGGTGSWLVESSLPDLTKAMQDAAPPDFALHSADAGTRRAVGFIRRKAAGADIYFIANTSNRPVDVAADLASAFAGGEIIDPDSGASTATSRNVDFELAPYESRIVVLHAGAAPAKKSLSAASPTVQDLSRNWDVSFVALGKTVHENAPSSWTSDPATLHYSGEAVYTRSVAMDAAALRKGQRFLLAVEGGHPEPGDPNAPWPGDDHRVLGPDGLPNPLVTGTGPGMHAYYDPPLHEAALVVVNGKPAGALWHPPYRLDITSLLHAGQNTIELHVYNTALNAWSGIPPRDYTALKAKYGDRFQMQDMDKVRPIVSGITGDVKLLEESAQ